MPLCLVYFGRPRIVGPRNKRYPPTFYAKGYIFPIKITVGSVGFGARHWQDQTSHRTQQIECNFPSDEAFKFAN